MSKLKPLPKFVIILAIAAGAGYGIKMAYDSGMFKESSPRIEEVVQHPAVVQSLPTTPLAAPVPSPTPQPHPSSDQPSAGLSKLLESGRKR